MTDVDASSWLASIVATIQEAPVSPELWDEVLASTLAKTGAHVGFFLGLGNSDGEKAAVVARGAPKATLLCPELVSFFDVSTLALGQGATFEVELRDVAARPEARSLHDAFGDGGLVWGVLIAREGQRRFAMILFHANSSSRAWTKQKEEVMSLLPYLQVSFKTHRELVKQRELAERMEFIFINTPTPRALIRADLKIVLANRAFVTLATDNPDIAISDGEFEIRNPSLSDEIHGPLEAIIAGRIDHRVLWVRRDSDPHGWLVSISTANRNGHNSIPFKAAVALPERVALLSIRELGRNDSLNPDVIRVALGLSATEASLACALANGDSSTEIALARRVSKNTVHNQLASAMNRLGLHRQMQFQNLLALLSSFV